MGYLEEQAPLGYHVLDSTIPLSLCQSGIFDLGLGDGTIRPDAAMGYAACVDAERNHPRSGIVGAGTGASVGKVCGIGQGEKSGIGYAALEVNGLQVGAVAVVNAFGDIFDHQTGQKLAGMRTPDRTAYTSAAQALYQQQEPQPAGANTTLGAVFTNAAFSQAEMNKIASMARAAFGPLHQSSGHHDRRGHHLRLLPGGGSGGYQRRGCAGGGGAGVRHRGRGEKF